MLYGASTKGLRRDNNGDLSLEPAHMYPCVKPSTQEATNVDSALDLKCVCIRCRWNRARRFIS